ncbi:MAG TPA: type I phosphomannose isomerase catalytic subunit [Acidobacteriaceae bacterium]|jgi:mannose-6-phosphate isomerase|nr:type I phosphomannose isomerase catalytic subunit [Acidobacteriaceae bacterium]
MPAAQDSAAEWKSRRGAECAPEIVVLKPRLDERIWGVAKLPSFLEQPQPGRPVGEAWLTDMRCAAEQPAGTTLGELSRRWPAAFGADERGDFPLLVKFLFPREKLSVQVHPNDEEARRVGQPRGKTECWYVLSAEPGAEIALGLREELSPAEMEEAIHAGTLESKLRYVPVKTGDMVFVEAGTIHAMGPGVVMLETQQYSDTTYRLYDYGRPRELHLKEGIAVTKPRTASGLVTAVEHEGFTRLIGTRYFVVDRFRPIAGKAAELGVAGQMQILIALNEGSALRLASGRVVALPAGHAVVLPAAPDLCHLLTGNGDVEVIRVSTGGS